MRRSSALLAALSIGLLAAPAAADDLLGRWRIEIVDGPSRGDHGVIDIRKPAEGEPSPLSESPPLDDGQTLYFGAMVFTDSRSDVTAEEVCEVRQRGEMVTVRCHVAQPGWLPDDFDLIRIGPDRMKGPHSSAVSGQGLFLRERPPAPTS